MVAYAVIMFTVSALFVLVSVLIGFAVGVAAIVRVQKKYNGGVF